MSDPGNYRTLGGGGGGGGGGRGPGVFNDTNDSLQRKYLLAVNTLTGLLTMVPKVLLALH